MTPSSVLRLVFRVILVAVLVASGTYLLVYLYRWEWNRALISGLFFLIAEVAFLGAVVVRRLVALERRIGDRPSGPSSEADTPAPPTRREGDDETPMFPWLEPGSLGVFVPVLLGVGAILSALAYAVERIAAATANGNRSDPRLATIALPPGSLRDAPPDATNPTADRSNARRAVVTGALAVAAITGLVVALANGATYREGRDPVSGTTTVLLRIETRSGPANASAVADTLWMTCRGNVDDDVSLVGVEAVAPNVASLMVTPRIAANDERRFLGCLEDLRFDGVRVEVTSWAEVHLSSPGPDSGSAMPTTTEASIVGVAGSQTGEHPVSPLSHGLWGESPDSFPVGARGGLEVTHAAWC